MDDNLAAEKLIELAQRSKRQRKQHYARQPKQASNIIAQLLAKKGYGATESNEQLQNAWVKAVGPLAKFSRPASIKHGRLEVTVANSAMMQELTFDKNQLLRAMQQTLPDARMNEIRFRVGKITS